MASALKNKAHQCRGKHEAGSIALAQQQCLFCCKVRASAGSRNWAAMRTLLIQCMIVYIEREHSAQM